jgi:hypothetical protein
VHKRLTIMTSNFTSKTAPIDRNWSRVLGDLTAVADCTGPDRRRNP